MIRLCVLYISLITCYIIPSFTATASEKFQIITDEETEEYLTDWLSKFFKVAGVSAQPRVYLIKTTDVNAAATYGGIILVYTGLILKCKNAKQLLGVLAHETGHIAGGHMAKMSAAVDQASVPALASVILGGAASLLSGNPMPLIAGLSGGAHVFERSMLSHSRVQEDSADASALIYLNALNLPVSGLAEFHDLLGNHYATGKEDPYIQTHPLPRDRKEKVQLYSQQQKFCPVPTDVEEKFQRIRAKLFGYMKTPIDVLKEYPPSDTSVHAEYGRLINEYVNSSRPDKASVALVKLEKLLKQVPEDPYFLEMQGQFLFETGQSPQEAITYLEKALSKRPNAQSIRLMLCHALVESSANNPENLSRAITDLTKVVEQKPDDVFAWRLLGTAYGKKEQAFDAASCLAEAALLTGDNELAKGQARRGLQATNKALKTKAADILAHLESGNA